MTELYTQVLVVGAGPVGLALAGDLGWRRLSSILVKKTNCAITQPKMDLIGPRTMDFPRRWASGCAYNSAMQSFRAYEQYYLLNVSDAPVLKTLNWLRPVPQ